MKTDPVGLSARLSSFGLLFSLVTAVCVGCQTRQWSWGFTLFFLGLALLTALPVVLKGRFLLSPWVIGISLATTVWFSWRAWMSPVSETATSDFLLLMMAAGGAAVAGFLFTDRKASSPLLWGLSGLIAASVVVCVIQNQDSTYAPFLRNRPYPFPSGFFGHYNECANFFIGGSLLLGAFAISGTQPLWIRITWGLVSLSGTFGVYLTHSRGGILALVAGLLSGLALLLILHRHSRWFGITLVVAPVVAIVAIAFLAKGWAKAQHVRGTDITEASVYPLVDGVMDNPIRLTFLEIAAEAVAEAPWAGSGSGSFGWNAYQLWDTKEHGVIRARPEVVHNELMQSATDYGIIGTLLILSLFTILSINGSVRCLLPENGLEHFSPAILGGMAGLIGMFVQSCFSSVFHLAPGALLLGVCLGALSAGSRTVSLSFPKRRNWIALGLPMFVAGVTVLILSIPRARMTAALWNTYFKGASVPSAWETARHLDEATRIVPLPSSLAELGMVLFGLSRSEDELAGEAEAQAIDALASSLSGNPKNPTASLNLANLLSNSGRDSDAETEYRRTIQLQGSAENLFLAHFRLAEHFLKMGIGAYDSKQLEQAIQFFEAAQTEIAASDKLAPWLKQSSHPWITAVYQVNEYLGLTLEMTGDLEGALECYSTAAKIFPPAHFHMARVMERIARADWGERRSSQALWMFQKALDHFRRANELPRGVTLEESTKKIAEVEATIRFLLEAGIQPIER